MPSPSLAPHASPPPPIEARARVRRGLWIALGGFASLLAVALLVLAVRASSPPAPPHHAASASAAASAPAPPVEEDRTPEIRGRILDGDGNPVSGANVRLVSVRPPYSVYRDARSDGEGAFSFSRMGAWRARVVADHDPDGIVTSAVLDASEHRTIEVTLVLSAAGAVRGSVVDAQGHPVAGAAVSLEGVPWIVPAAASDAAGAFALLTVPDEATTLVAVARGYRTARASLPPRADQAERAVRLVLTAADPVHGDVRDEDGNPVRARIVACEDEPSEARVGSGDDGAFELPPSAIGCDAIAEQAEHAPSDPALVAEGARIALRLKAGGAIEGNVVDDRGLPLSPFSIGVESFTPPRGHGFDGMPPRNVDDARGAFRWDHLAPGTYVLTAGAAGKPPARSAPVEVQAAVVSRGVRIVVTAGGTLMGHVFDDANAPLAGAELRFDQVSSVVASKASTRTDATGAYRLDGAPDGPVTLLARKDGYRARLISGIRVDSGATRRQDVVLTALDGGGGLELGGIGAALTQSAGSVSLGDVFGGDPAARAGLRTGDRILRIDGEPTDGMSMADVLQRLRGEAGTSVGVSAVRPETGERMELTIVRGKIVR